MLHRLKVLVQSIRESFAAKSAGFGSAAATSVQQTISSIAPPKGVLIAIAVVAGTGYAIYNHPPMQSINRGELGVRENLLTGTVTEWREGSVVVLPGLHAMRTYQMRDQTYRPEQIRNATGTAPLQSL